MILVDTSVVIDYVRTADQRLLWLFVNHNAICGVTRAELLQGVRNAQDRARTLVALNGFQAVPTPEAVWDLVGDHALILRRGGVTMPFADVIIATGAITHDLELWTRDGHFRLAQPLLPALRLFTEPP